MDSRFQALAELCVSATAVQPGQVVAVGAYTGQEELARAVAEAAYAAGALYVDVLYFDPFVKRSRITHADPETLDFVPSWLPARLEALAERGDARIGFAGIVAPNALAGLDPALSGRDQLPWLKEASRIVSERLTNWNIVPCPHPEWAKVVFPDLSADAAYDKLWDQLWHILRLDEPDPAAAWAARSDQLKASAAALNARRFDALHFAGEGTDLTVGLLPSGTFGGGAFTNVNGIVHLPNVPTEEVFTSPDPERTEGFVTSTKPLVFRDGTIVEGLKVRFEGGRAVEITADVNGEGLRSKTELDEGAARLGEVAIVDGQGRIGPLGTVFYDTLLDENAASHIALGGGFGFAADDQADRDRINKSGIHIDFMIGSPEMEIDGITHAGERIPVLRSGKWQI